MHWVELANILRAALGKVQRIHLLVSCVWRGSGFEFRLIAEMSLGSPKMRLRHVSLWAALLLMLCTAMAQAQDSGPRQGLMWNRTGLPAVFPLQVKTRPGQNYVLLLSDAQTDADVLAAYITGGAFFRVLVPPGTFRVRFASGITWQGKEAMFGRHGQTKVIELPEALTFEVIGLRRKAGHLIDLTTLDAGDLAQAETHALQICQYFGLGQGAFAARSLKRSSLGGRDPHSDLTIRSRYCLPS